VQEFKISFHLLEMEIKCFNTRHLTRGSLKVRIVKVDSPTFLWVQLENSREDLEELLEDLTRRMTRRGRLLRHRPDHVLPNEIVAVREGKGWQRGIVIQLGTWSPSPCEIGAMPSNGHITTYIYWKTDSARWNGKLSLAGSLTSSL